MTEIEVLTDHLERAATQTADATAGMTMNPAEAVLRQELEARRLRLTAALAESPRRELVELLHRLDFTLDRLGTNEWGVCVVCNGSVETERLKRDPTITVCLECLDASQRRDLERDLETAAQVQAALLPPVELTRGDWQTAYLWEPLGAVSGDHIDLLPSDQAEGPFHMLLGDVAGKGIAASLLQSQLHALFRAANAPGVELDQLVSRVNRLFSNAIGPHAYATLVAARLGADGLVEWVNAGHPPPFVIGSGGVRELNGHDLPLGMFSDSPFERHETRLAPGETLVLYTDGWTEAPNGSGEYGRRRAAEILDAHRDASLRDLLQACRRDMLEFLGNCRRIDDFSLLGLRRAA